MSDRLRFCINRECLDYGVEGRGNIVGYGRKVRRFRCKTCGRVFSASKGTFFYRLRTDVEVVIEALHLLLEGNSIAAVARVKGVKEETVANWLKKASEHADEVNSFLVRDLHLTQVQVDELWGFIKKRRRTSTPKKTILVRRVTFGPGSPSSRIRSSE